MDHYTITNLNTDCEIQYFTDGFILLIFSDTGGYT